MSKTNAVASQIIGQAVANAVSGERGHMQVAFPVTGDKELDFISAVIVLANELKLEPCHAERGCDYLKARFHSMVIDLSKATMQSYQQQQLSAMANSAGFQYGQLANSLSQKNNLGAFDMPAVYDPAICMEDPKEAVKSFGSIMDTIKAQWQKQKNAHLHHGR